MKKHTNNLASLALLIIVAMNACAPQNVPNDINTEMVKLKVYTSPYLAFGPFFIANEEGFFREQGIEVEFVQLSDRSQVLVSLAQGQLDVASVLLTASLPNALAAEGVNIRIVGDQSRIGSGGCSYAALMVRTPLIETGILEKLTPGQRLRVDVDETSIEGYYFDRVLNLVGLTAENIEVVTVPAAAQIDNLQNGTIDITATGEPFITLIQQSGYGRELMRLPEIVPDMQLSVVLFGKTLLLENVEVGNRFMVAYLKGVRRFNEGKTARNIEIMAQYLGLDNELLKNVCWPAIDKDGNINTQTIMDFQEWAVSKKLVNTIIPLEGLWEPKFAQLASDRLATQSP